MAGSAANSHVNTTSSAVKGFPSCHWTFRLSFQVTERPSFATPPLSSVGTSAARTGTRLPSGSIAASGSLKSRDPSLSFTPTARWQFRMLTACHQSVLSSPPPPRRAGVNAGLAWAWATPTDASIWAAIGAVSPRPTIMRVNDRRLRVPSLTRPTQPRSSRSSMRCSSLRSR